MKTWGCSWLGASGVFIVLTIAALTAPISVLGQDRCGDILTSGVHNTYQNISKDNAKSSYQRALCDKYKTTQNSGSSTNLGISVPGYGDLNFGQGNSSASGMYHNYCEATHQEMSDDDFRSLVQVTIDPNIVENWRECMDNHGRGLYGNVDVNGHDLLFTIEWNGFAGVTTATVNQPPQITGAVCDNPPLKNGVVLQDQVGVTELCTRSGDSAVTFVVNTTGGPKTLKVEPPRKPVIVSAQRYKPIDPTMPLAPAMNIAVAKSDLGTSYHLDVSFTVPPVPKGATLPYPYNLIRVWGSRTQGLTGEPLSPSTFPSTTGTWGPGDQVTLNIDVPKQFADPEQGWVIAFCIGSAAKGCVPSPNLLTGSPLP